MPSRRASAPAPPNSNLYCGRCDSQIGIFENEWLHLTPSYAHAKNNGTSFGMTTEYGTQVVPRGKDGNEAEGCMMARITCNQCSSTIAQCCKEAPLPKQQYLIDRYFYKISRVYLKDARSSERVAFSFVDDYFVEPERPRSVRSSNPPPQKWSSRVTPSHPPSARRSYSSMIPQQVPPGTLQEPIELSPTEVIQHYSRSQSIETSSEQPHFQQQWHQVFQQQHPPVGPAQRTDRVDMLHPEMYKQRVAITDCSHQMVAMEARFTSESPRSSHLETRITNSEDRIRRSEGSINSHQKALQQLEADYRFQGEEHIKHERLVQQQGHEIEEQQGQIQCMNKKLEKLRKSMEELRKEMEDNRQIAVAQRAPRPDSQDFLENLEVMVRAMRDARNNDQEKQALRNENKAMKARLRSIASAMGKEAIEAPNLIEDDGVGDSTCVADGSQILRKRKRATEAEEQSRKASRLTLHTLKSLKQGEQLLTPDSTQSDQQSQRGCGTSSDDEQLAEQHDQEELGFSQAQPHLEDSMPVVDEGGGVPTAQGPGVNALPVEETSMPATAEIGDDEAEATDKAEQSSALLIPTTVSGMQARHETDPANQIRFQGQPNFLSSLQPASFDHPYYAVPPHMIPTAFSSSSRSTFASGIPSATLSPYFGGVVLPQSLLSPSAYATSIQSSLLGRRASNEAGPFSDALNRGQRLEDLLTRGGRSSYAASQATTTSPTTNSATTATTGKPYGMTSTSHIAVGNAEAIDFSDEENVVPAQQKSEAPEFVQTTSTTPVGQPLQQLPRSTLVSRIVPGEHSESLKRPSMEPPKSRGNEVWRRSTGSQPPMVMPEFAAAIRNLNSSAARNSTTPASSTASPRLSTLTPPPAADVRTKTRKSEPIARVMVEEPRFVSSTGNTQRDFRTLDRQGTVGTHPTQHEVEKKSNAHKRVVLGSSRSAANNAFANKKTSPKTKAIPGVLAKEADSSRTELAEKQQNDDHCAICQKRGKVLLCDGCPKSYHHRCLKPALNPKHEIMDDWYCPSCVESREKRQKAERASVAPQLLEQTLRERNRLAQETMIREEAAAVAGRVR